MLPRDKTQQIQIRASEKFRQTTEAIADSLNMTLSDYIRLAVETYNKQYQQKETIIVAPGYVDPKIKESVKMVKPLTKGGKGK